MPYQLEDIVEVFDKLGLHEERGEGETAFPPMVKLINRLESVVNRRKRAEQEAKEELENQEKLRRYEADLAANPEKYAARDREFEERKRALERRCGIVPPKPTPPPVMSTCPHCDNSLPLAAGVYLMSAKKVIEMGQLMERMEAQAAERKGAKASAPTT